MFSFIPLRRAATVLITCLLLIIPISRKAAGQNSSPPSYAEFMQQNNKALRAYTWRMVTVISYKNEKKSMRTMRVYLDESGEQVRELIMEKRLAPMPGGIKGMIMRQKQEELSGKMPELIAGIKGYLMPDIERFNAAVQAGAQVSRSEDEIRIILRNFLQAGDRVTFRSSKAGTPLQVKFTGEIAGEEVRVTARFAPLDGSIIYTQSLVIELLDEDIRIASVAEGHQVRP